jgi:WD40 repeat protein
MVLAHGSPVEALAALPDGRVASGGRDGKIKLWSKDGASEPILTQGSEVLSLAVMADGRLASGDRGGKIKLWPSDVTSQPTVLSHGSSVKRLAVLPDGRLASGSDDGTIKLWLVDEQKLLVAICLRLGRDLEGRLGTGHRSEHSLAAQLS